MKKMVITVAGTVPATDLTIPQRISVERVIRMLSKPDSPEWFFFRERFSEGQAK